MLHLLFDADWWGQFVPPYDSEDAGDRPATGSSVAPPRVVDARVMSDADLLAMQVF